MRLKTKGYVAIAIAVIELAFLPIMIEIGASGIGNIQLAFYIILQRIQGPRYRPS